MLASLLVRRMSGDGEGPIPWPLSGADPWALRRGGGSRAFGPSRWVHRQFVRRSRALRYTRLSFVTAGGRACGGERTAKMWARLLSELPDVEPVDRGVGAAGAAGALAGRPWAASSHNARLSAVTSEFVQVRAFLSLSCEQ